MILIHLMPLIGISLLRFSFSFLSLFFLFSFSFLSLFSFFPSHFPFSFKKQKTKTDDKRFKKRATKTSGNTNI